VTSQISSDDNNIRQMLFQVKVAGLGDTDWAKPCVTTLMKECGNTENCKDKNSTTLHEETLEVYLQGLDVNSSSYAVDSQGCS
jgi:uncharacterized lipoprotein